MLKSHVGFPYTNRHPEVKIDVFHSMFKRLEKRSDVLAGSLGAQTCD
jgi:hypothetical protein